MDESFRKHHRGTEFGVLSGVAIPELLFHSVQADIYQIRKPYHGKVIQEDDEIHGSLLLNGTTFKMKEKNGVSAHWSLAEDLLGYSRVKGLKVFGVVCFRPELKSFICNNDRRLDATYRYLFERIDGYMKRDFPGRFAKVVFDNRDHRTHEKNARAITNFFVRSAVGLGHDSIIRTPFFAVSQGHNHGLQLADLITTVIGLRFQGERRIDPLWRIVQDMIAPPGPNNTQLSGLKVIRNIGP